MNFFLLAPSSDNLEHSAKGTTWKKHKYLEKKNGRYVYKTDDKRQRARISSNYKEEMYKNKLKDFKNSPEYHEAALRYMGNYGGLRSQDQEVLNKAHELEKMASQEAGHRRANRDEQHNDEVFRDPKIETYRQILNKTLDIKDGLLSWKNIINKIRR